MEKNQLVIAFLVGVVVALGTALMLQTSIVPQAHAQTSEGGPQLFAVTGTGFQGQSRDTIFLVDPAAPRLVAYEYNNGRLELKAVRNIEYEFRFEQWNTRGRDQEPSVADMKRASEESEDEGGRRRR